jgi:hypothetical protein
MTACPEPWVFVALVWVGVVIAAVLFVLADRRYRQSRRLCDGTLADMKRRTARMRETMREVAP